MNGMTQYFGRGLLVLALCGWAVGCGDDDDSGGNDSGVDSGAGGSGGTGGGGSGGSKDAGGSGGSTDAGGTITKDQCITMVNGTSSHASDACISCACEKDAETVAGCDSDCWALIECVATMCGGDAMMAGCFGADKCMTQLGKADTTVATNTGNVLTMMCSTECVVPSGTDGGAEDAGN